MSHPTYKDTNSPPGPGPDVNSPRRPPSVYSMPPPSYTSDTGSIDGDSQHTVTPAPSYHATGTSGTSVQENGRIDIDFDSRAVRTLSRLYALVPPPTTEGRDSRVDKPATPEKSTIPKLNIVVQVVGSRGDVQPFIALGNELQNHGHRVRIATHDVFGSFVRDHGLEFYPIGGDPATLMAYMVKNPGLLPSMESLKAGDIQEKREMVTEMLDGCWDSCLLPDLYTGQPFVADAIIANPPSFAHMHCAEALGIPVHLMFTMPWSRTTAFPHPLANLKNVSGEAGVKNRMSYIVVEWAIFSGLGDLINEWRHQIGLEAVGMFEGPELASMLEVPFTYCCLLWVITATDWCSPTGTVDKHWLTSCKALIPKPDDWLSNIDVSGFFFREAPRYQPPPELEAFLVAGPTPVYIGFGSIVLENPNDMLLMILDAVQAAGARAIISKGWSNLETKNRDDIYLIGDCPHEWLFNKVAAVVHHGGAGTTACGLKNGKPTYIIPFFGNQLFWGQMVASAGAGPPPLPHKQMSANKLSEGIRYCLSQEAAIAAQTISGKMQAENGVRAAAESFHRHLPLSQMQCDLLDQPATWKLKIDKRELKLSKLAVEAVLAERPALKKHLQMLQTKPIHIDTRRWDPLSGGSSAVLATTMDLIGCMTGMVTKPVDEVKSEQRRRARDKRKLESVGDTAFLMSASDTTSLDKADTASIRTTRSDSGRGSLAGKAAAASAKSIGMFAPTALKGMVADIPFAITEGLRTIPHHYNDTVRDHGAVVDFKTGAAVAGKTFVWGFVDGISGLVTLPYAGAKKEGALGAAKGLGKGVASLVTKSGAGMFGVFAYPSMGIAKSVWTAFHSGTRKAIALERRKEGAWLLASNLARRMLNG